MNTRTLGYLIQADIPVLAWSDPGEGKTQYMMAFARALGMPAHVEILSQADPTDIGGWPREDGGIIKRKPLQWLAAAAERPTLIFLDEITLAPRACLAAALRLVNERTAGELTLHPGTRIVAAANPSDFTGVDLLPQTANRFAHVNFPDVIPLSDWVTGMLSGFPTPTVAELPKTWETKVPMHRALVASFCSKMPTEAFRKPTDAASYGRAWPSRRSWDFAARASAACEAGHEQDSLAIAALVGHGPATAYVSWRAAQDMPSPEAVLADPEKHPLPKEDERLYVVLSAVAAAAVAQATAKAWGAAWIVCRRACEMKRADIAIVAARVLAANRPEGAQVSKDITVMLPMLQVAMGR